MPDKSVASLKVLHLSAFDVAGGAARATYRLHTGLQEAGIDSQLFVQQKTSSDSSVVGPRVRLTQGYTRSRATLDALPLKLYPRRSGGSFSVQWLPSWGISNIQKYDPDIIHLHWINDAFIRIEDLKQFGKPLVWTLHDMWPFSGGCHYAEHCKGYQSACGQCPLLGSTRQWDLSAWVWRRKSKAWQSLDLTVVCPSQWLAERARESTLFQDVNVQVIPHGLDTQTYAPVDQLWARRLLNLPLDKKIVMFGAINSTSDPRKGFAFIVSALKTLKQKNLVDDVTFVVFGNPKSEKGVDLEVDCRYLGQFHDDLSLSILYSAADVMVVPSTQEAFGQTAFEALACGTPVVSFDSTGLKDIVDHQETGYRARCFDPQDLAQGIQWVIEDETRQAQLSLNARAKAVSQYSLPMRAADYIALYQATLGSSDCL
jgi:glycosyltransferase involved in cell wall biosynthesis